MAIETKFLKEIFEINIEIYSFWFYLVDCLIFFSLFLYMICKIRKKKRELLSDIELTCFKIKQYTKSSKNLNCKMSLEFGQKTALERNLTDIWHLQNSLFLNSNFLNFISIWSPIIYQESKKKRRETTFLIEQFTMFYFLRICDTFK